MLGAWDLGGLMDQLDQLYPSGGGEAHPRHAKANAAAWELGGQGNPDAFRTNGGSCGSGRSRSSSGSRRAARGHTSRPDEPGQR